ncbi:hypothetical protein [Novosphingobium sp. SG919]|uniref:hypothetical protein n=1 Tax=Novosphingobium sp. SG919 TaxID=2587133 RepID=UPI00146DD327|nr:hypothetical protein [Novosphingobium sp. SG919]
MAPGYRLFFFTAFLSLVIAVALGSLLQPERPNLVGSIGQREQPNFYRAVGSDCQPARISVLPVKLRTRKADACAKAEEQYREANDSLVQARRAADAADASAIVAYEQTRIAAWGFSAGILTLLAAFAAAFFAERAAHHTKRSADAAEQALRPWITMEIEPESSVRWDDDGAWFNVLVKVYNHGSVPAVNFLIDFANVPMEAIAILQGNFRKEIEGKIDSITAPDGFGEIITPGKYAEFRFQAEVNQEWFLPDTTGKICCAPLVAVFCRYQSANDLKLNGKLGQCYMFGVRPPLARKAQPAANLVLYPDQGEIEPSKIKVRLLPLSSVAK